jgi:hypothetical protein
VLPDGSSYAVGYTYNPSNGLRETVQYPASVGTTPLTVKYEYSRGMLSKASDFNNASTVFWQASSYDGLGNPTWESLGTSTPVTVQSDYDQLNGLWNYRWADDTGGNSAWGPDLQALMFSWDEAGNLTEQGINHIAGWQLQHHDSDLRLRKHESVGLRVGVGELLVAPNFGTHQCAIAALCLPYLAC